MLIRNWLFWSFGLSTTLLSASAYSANHLSEAVARTKAATILKGDPYGSTVAIAANKIEKAQLISGGSTECGTPASKRPVWQFRVVVPKRGDQDAIEGYLVIDAVSGKLQCAGLPFLD